MDGLDRPVEEVGRLPMVPDKIWLVTEGIRGTVTSLARAE
jgi:hypothetical protein